MEEDLVQMRNSNAALEMSDGGKRMTMMGFFEHLFPFNGFENIEPQPLSFKWAKILLFEHTGTFLSFG